MILPILGVLAVLYWLAAPDPVTAGLRTASGTGARAAGAGVREHWSGGREQRQGRRTARRERWDGRVKGAKPHPWLLRGDRALTWAWGTGKTLAGITRAALKPVPAAVSTGWKSGRERHRNRAGNRPVPVALDPPWWRREQATEQASGTGQERAPEQVQDSPWVIDVDALPDEGRRYWLTELGFDPETPRGQDPVPIASPPPQNKPEQVEDSPQEQPLDTEEQIRARRTPAWDRAFPEPMTESERRFWTARDGRYADPLDQDGRPDDPDQWPFKTDPDPTDTTTEQPATPTEGDPVFTSLDTDLDDLTTVQDFALKVADMAEESDFAQLVEFCKGASDEVRDFGADMAADVAEFEEVAAKIGDLLSELVDAAQKVKDRGAELVGG